MILYFVQPILSVVVLVWSVLYWWFSVAFARYKLRFDIENAAMDTKVGGRLADTITNNITIKLFGEVIGITLMGFLGGFISSTAVFANLSHTLHAHPKSSAAITASALFATLSMLIEVMLIVFIASPDFLFSIIKPMLIMCIITIFLALLSLHFNKKNHSRTSLPVSPLNFFSLLRTTLLITSTLILISLAKHFVGTEAVLIIAFLTGLFEIHGISLATALLFLNQHVPLETACLILFTAIFAAFISKFFLLWTLTPKRFALTTSLYLIAIVASGGIAYWLFLLT